MGVFEIRQNYLHTYRLKLVCMSQKLPVIDPETPGARRLKMFIMPKEKPHRVTSGRSLDHQISGRPAPSISLCSASTTFRRKFQKSCKAPQELET